ncbi:hypothetical protein F5B21DRAFT_461985 [Xylaria acuta]|nr:hypothetical protein F5B21DRAFT_461985 [Xylaria acuta]
MLPNPFDMHRHSPPALADVYVSHFLLIKVALPIPIIHAMLRVRHTIMGRPDASLKADKFKPKLRALAMGDSHVYISRLFGAANRWRRVVRVCCAWVSVMVLGGDGPADTVTPRVIFRADHSHPASSVERPTMCRLAWATSASSVSGRVAEMWTICWLPPSVSWCASA